MISTQEAAALNRQYAEESHSCLLTLGQINCAMRRRIVRRQNNKDKRRSKQDICRICGDICAYHDDGNICPKCSQD